jgi:hypothetical protein
LSANTYQPKQHKSCQYEKPHGVLSQKFAHQTAAVTIRPLGLVHEKEGASIKQMLPDTGKSQRHASEINHIVAPPLTEQSGSRGNTFETNNFNSPPCGQQLMKHRSDLRMTLRTGMG